ncbi:hypothetical protein CMUS01_03666 [Colletotrichum musicola]|uniref:Uncharacterized protein n=2 Tax=Colletotrichum orchidearum species complex TaxID=2707337 RepID=A0A8H6NR51_9PEZI|nr:hypothetical protein CMUS01_03666 [Colletotrichum musicola]
MVSTRFVTLLSAAAAVVSAAPIVENDTALNVTDTVDRNLRNGELLVYGVDGRTSIITEETWGMFLKQMNVLPEPPQDVEEWLKAGEGMAEEAFNATETNLQKRQCSSQYSTVIDRSERFVDWDVQMSPVVIGAGKNGIDITISKSYSIANSVSVSGGLDFGLIKDRLKASVGVDFSRTWTTQAGVLIRGTVDNGETGVVITRPWTTRRYGRAFQGCVGSLKQTGTFTADSHEEGSYEGVTWVSGAITACIKKQRSIPLSRCNGSGNFR